MQLQMPLAFPARASVEPRVKTANNFNMQRPIIRWSREGDVLTSARAEQHILLVGGTGSSKTTAGMHLVASSLLESSWGCLFLTAKPKAAEEAYALAAAAGRKHDVIEFGPDMCGHNRGVCCNVWDYEYQTFGTGGGSVDNLMAVFKPVMEVMLRSSGNRQSEPFWEYLNEQGFRNMFFLDGKANGSIDISRMLQMWQSIPQNLGEVEDPRGLFSMLALLKAENNCSPADKRALGLAKGWLTDQMPRLAERTRSCVEAMAIGMLDSAARDVMYQAMGGKSTFTPQDILDGKICICYWDIKRFGPISKVIQVALKRSLQMAAERRLAKFSNNLAAARPVAIIADEMQFFIDSGDLEFLRTARESRAAMVGSIQSLPSVEYELGGDERAKTLTKAILGQFQTKLFFQNGCTETNRWASMVIGEDIQKRHGGSVGASHGATNYNANWQEQREPIIPTIAFQRLPRGGPEYNWDARAYVHMEGYDWKCNPDQYWAKIKIPQSCAPDRRPSLRHPMDVKEPRAMFFDKVPTARKWARHTPWQTVLRDWWNETDPRKRERILAQWVYFWCGVDAAYLPGGPDGR